MNCCKYVYNTYHEVLNSVLGAVVAALSGHEGPFVMCDATKSCAAASNGWERDPENKKNNIIPTQF